MSSEGRVLFWDSMSGSVVKPKSNVVFSLVRRIKETVLTGGEKNKEELGSIFGKQRKFFFTDTNQGFLQSEKNARLGVEWKSETTKLGFYLSEEAGVQTQELRQSSRTPFRNCFVTQTNDQDSMRSAVNR